MSVEWPLSEVSAGEPSGPPQGETDPSFPSMPAPKTLSNRPSGAAPIAAPGAAPEAAPEAVVVHRRNTAESLEMQVPRPLLA